NRIGQCGNTFEVELQRSVAKENSQRTRAIAQPPNKRSELRNVDPNATVAQINWRRETQSQARPTCIVRRDKVTGTEGRRGDTDYRFGVLVDRNVGYCDAFAGTDSRKSRNGSYSICLCRLSPSASQRHDFDQFKPRTAWAKSVGGEFAECRHEVRRQV